MILHCIALCVCVVDNIDSPKGKDKDENKGVSKTWKGKMVKKFKRYGSSSTAPVEISGTFGVPLDMCPPSTFNEVIVRLLFELKRGNRHQTQT